MVRWQIIKETYGQMANNIQTYGQMANNIQTYGQMANNKKNLLLDGK